MRAITVIQPWASLIGDGHKTSETRSWGPPNSLKGQRIAIHAGKNREDLDAFPDIYGDGKQLPLGSIVCTAQLVGAIRVAQSRRVGEHILVRGDYKIVYSRDPLDANDPYEVKVDDYGDYSVGRWIWLLQDVERVNHHKAIRGHLGLWVIDDDFVNGLF